MNPSPSSPDPHPRDLFLDALEKTAPAERAAFLDAACRGNTALRCAVEKLLANHRDDGFLESPAISSAGDAAPTTEQPGDRIGHYKLIEPIGEGGFGVVWMAEQAEPVRRLVALKIIKLGMDTREVMARFEQERQALALMDHPNIARVFDAGATKSGRPFFVMELVRGVRITGYCDEQRLPIQARLALFIPVCKAVQHAHQKGIIHRDLKPSNILVTLHDGEPVPMVIDFGVAKATQGRLTEATLLTQCQQMLGTPLYMSPEQAGLASADIDTRSDIYSLGILLYELLTGRTPIDAATLANAGIDEVRRLIRDMDPPRPSARVSALDPEELTSTAKCRDTEAARLPVMLSGDLDWIVMKCLEKDRRRRYDTANGLAQDLQRHLAHETVTARPPTAAYLITRFIQRNLLAVGAGAAIAVSLIIGITVSLRQSVRADREARRAREAEQQALATLAELRSTVPTFAAQARALAAQERFAEAIEKLDYVIKLTPEAVDPLLAKADLLQCRLKFSAAATAYRAVLRLSPGHLRALTNAALCERLQVEVDAGGKWSQEHLTQLFQRMLAEHRPAAELMSVGRLLGQEKQFVLDYWLGRLRDLPVPPARPIEKRLTMLADGRLSFDLSETPIVDLTPLEGMPLDQLNLSACASIADLRPLRDLSLRQLQADRTRVTDLAPLSRMMTLRILDVSTTGVSDLTPLRGLKLERLNLMATQVEDLAPLDGMPLVMLNIRATEVSTLRPLAGLPLQSLDCTAIPATDFPEIAAAPLRTLNLQHTQVGSLSFLRGMPLEHLMLNSCRQARGYAVLQELKALKSLLLSETDWTLPKEELAAIAALRSHPTLRDIATETARIPGQAIQNVEKTTEEFWRNWDRKVSWILALHRDGVKFSTAWLKDATLAVTIEDPTFAKLDVLQGADLASLSLIGTPIKDLTPLVATSIKRLQLRRVPVVDLSPLAGMAIEDLRLNEIPVANLGALKHPPLRDSLETLFLDHLHLADYSPIAACRRLRTLSTFQSSLQDLAPLRELRLQNLYIAGTKVTDLSPLIGMPLKEIFFDSVPVTDITPLLGMLSLRNVILPKSAARIESLRTLHNLQRISFLYNPKVPGPSMTAEEFWKSLEPAP